LLIKYFELVNYLKSKIIQKCQNAFNTYFAVFILQTIKHNEEIEIKHQIILKRKYLKNRNLNLQESYPNLNQMTQ